MVLSMLKRHWKQNSKRWVMTIGSRLYKNGKITGRLEFQTTGKKVHLNSKEWREFKARMNTTIFERGGRPYGER